MAAGPVGVADAPHLAGHLVERLVPADPLELPGPARPHPPQGVENPVRMVEPLELAEAPHAGVQRRHLRRPLPRIGADAHDAPVAHVSVDHAAAAAVVPAGAGDDGLAGGGGRAGRFVDGHPRA
jgi:hypothetical protein